MREEREELEEIRTQKDCVKAKGKEEDMNRTNEENDVSWIRVDDGIQHALLPNRLPMEMRSVEPNVKPKRDRVREMWKGKGERHTRRCSGNTLHFVLTSTCSS